MRVHLSNLILVTTEGPSVMHSQGQFRQALFICKCLSDPIALRICHLLWVRSKTIAELQRDLNLTRSQVNERLRKMRESSIIEIERSGRWLNFHLTEPFRPVYEQLMRMQTEF